MSAHQQDSVTNGKSIYGTDHDWRQRLDTIVSMMREMSRHVDPQVMVQTYRARVRDLLPVDRTVSLSRRDLQSPGFRITRSNLWKEEIDPWKEKDRLPRMALPSASVVMSCVSVLRVPISTDRVGVA